MAHIDFLRVLAATRGVLDLIIEFTPAFLHFVHTIPGADWNYILLCLLAISIRALERHVVERNRRNGVAVRATAYPTQDAPKTISSD